MFYIVVLAQSVWAVATGPRLAPDSMTYWRWAGQLVASRFDYGDLFSAWPYYPVYLYSGFVTIVAVLVEVAGGGWPSLLIALNLIANALTCAFVLVLLQRISGTHWNIAAFFLFLYAISFENLNWVRFALSDTIFTFMVAGSVFLSVLSVERTKYQVRLIVAVVTLGVVCCFFRPPGIIVLVSAATALTFTWIARRPSGAAQYVLVLLALVIGATGAFSFIMQEPNRWPFAFMSATVKSVSHYYQIGEVVSARPETFHAPPRGIAEYMLIVADRFLHFFAPYGATMSRMHKLYNLGFFSILYGGIAALALRHSSIPIGERSGLVVVGIFVLCFALAHAFIQVDYDWRYRAPVVPLMMVLAAVGYGSLLRKVKWYSA